MCKKLVTVILFLLFAVQVSAEVTTDAKIEIGGRIEQIVSLINSGDVYDWDAVISPTARPGLKAEIVDALAGKKIEFEEDIGSFKELEDGRVKVKGSYSLKSMNTSISGLPNNFIFERTPDGWLLYDTNFHKKFDGKDVFVLVGVILAIVFVVLIPFMVLWIWMLVDCITKCTESKTAWILVLIFAGFIGAILYYILVYRKRKKI
jgi:hypothetical protein